MDDAVSPRLMVRRLALSTRIMCMKITIPDSTTASVAWQIMDSSIHDAGCDGLVECRERGIARRSAFRT